MPKYVNKQISIALCYHCYQFITSVFLMKTEFVYFLLFSHHRPRYPLNIINNVVFSHRMQILLGHWPYILVAIDYFSSNIFLNKYVPWRHLSLSKKLNSCKIKYNREERLLIVKETVHVLAL